MLKQINKKKQSKIKIATPVTGQIVCGACKHVRKETDTCPDWQCPGCGAAYNKVKVQPDNKRMSREELHRRDVEDLQKMRARKRQIGLLRSIKEHPVLSGISLGVMTFANGIGTACSAANPLLKIAGIVILVGSIVYGLSQFWS